MQVRVEHSDSDLAVPQISTKSAPQVGRIYLGYDSIGPDYSLTTKITLSNEIALSLLMRLSRVRDFLCLEKRTSFPLLYIWNMIPLVIDLNNAVASVIIS